MFVNVSESKENNTQGIIAIEINKYNLKTVFNKMPCLLRRFFNGWSSPTSWNNHPFSRIDWWNRDRSSSVCGKKLTTARATIPFYLNNEWALTKMYFRLELIEWAIFLFSFNYRSSADSVIRRMKESGQTVITAYFLSYSIN